MNFSFIGGMGPGGGGNSQLAHNAALNIDVVPAEIRANKIVCTIGPKTQSVEALKGLIKSGMNVVRMNFSHGTHEFHEKTIVNARQAAAELNATIGLALDTKGPEIRTGLFENPDGVLIKTGSKVLLTCDPEVKEKGTADKFYVDYEDLCTTLAEGSKIYMDDGILDLTVTRIVDAKTLEVVSNNEHQLTNRKGVNLPKAKVTLPAVSDKDRADLAFGAKHEVDFIFASFIRSAQQVEEVRAALGDRGSKTLVFAKIENHEGVQNIDAILQRVDGIMVARGDLGVEIPAESVVLAQKMMIAKCNLAGKPVICATQMLESMTVNPRPTRAEVSDVANAVLDGADCVMLSGETAKGNYPNEVVSYMVRICRKAQMASRDSVLFASIKGMQQLPMAPEESVCSSGVNSVMELEAKFMVVLSNTGRSARLVAKYRPPCPVLCASQRKEVCRALTIVRGVEPVYYDTEALGEDLSRDRRVRLGMKEAVARGWAKAGDLCVAIHADHQTKGFANQTRVIPVPEGEIVV